MSLILWLIAGIISTCGAMVMLEFGSAIPRSGGIKIYLERSFSPKLLQTCVYLFYCVFLQVSASNAYTFSSYLLLATGVDQTTWKVRGVATASAVFAVGGHLRIDNPHNFDISTSFQGTSSNGYNIGTALLNAIFAFQGYDNVNAVLSEVKDPKRTLQIALPSAMAVITFAAVPKEDFISSKITIAASLFRNVFGDSAATKALPALVAISALGHLLGIAFTVPRVIQELAKDGVTPFPNTIMQNRPFKTPIFALALHLGVTILFICAPPAGDAFNFIVSLSSYPTTFLLTAITIGLVKLRLSNTERWNPTRPTPWFVIALYIAGNIFLLVMPFVRPPNGKGNTSLPYWLTSVVALGILSLGVIYYVLRFVLAPRVFGYVLQPTVVDLSDGSQVTRYKTIR
ncbi:uncharacterized protein BHQ10_001869 [Talaromyces amestolkiae]|uniref:Amino acid permease/ SLC12A domain-containing protein n=1 Tax=Talaromyces amestolkiae TaxID=1196081 RepID=A0A364KQM5_TALAM|nr:uncharacterized protein BHQ10_001869 [Talaromyces amestolkiae]RAO65857.1 hypothetical protein BHQ10_001869 [Talaromyces amestolkiae]